MSLACIIYSIYFTLPSRSIVGRVRHLLCNHWSVGFIELHVAGYDSTEPYDGRVRFYRVLFEDGYDMMMMMPTEANVLKSLCIYMYYAFHISNPQRHCDVTGCISSISFFTLLFLFMLSCLTYSVLYSYWRPFCLGTLHFMPAGPDW